MKRLNVAAMLLAAAFFVGFGTTASAEGMKCGAGKCGSKMEKPVKKMKCGAKMDKAEAKKCGDAKKAKKKAMKCGVGKCGGNK
ncbi:MULTISPECIES: hypothetical protein [Sulfurimonas]|uniref:hypothetical protein n=1 Tax=Sulfurimonas TaxID=202746 RepID=UPI0012644A8C|nr:hypothetical protein [Sulfurimonas indica]